MKIELDLEDIERVREALKALFDFGFEREDIKIIIPPKEYKRLPEEFKDRHFEIEAEEGVLKIHGAEVEVEIRKS